MIQANRTCSIHGTPLNGDGKCFPCEHPEQALLCPVHASLDSRDELKPFDNCIACIRNERDELRAELQRERDAVLGLVEKWQAEGKRCYDLAHKNSKIEESVMAQGVRFWECARELEAALKGKP